MNNAVKIYATCRMIAIISFVVTLGGCFACIDSTKTTYGPEEYYQKPGGGVGYGASASHSGGESYTYLALLSGIVFVISGFAAGISYGETPEGRKASMDRARIQVEKERRGK